MEPLDWAFLPFKRYFDFEGRSSRAEYWFFTALMCLVTLFIMLVELVLGKTNQSLVVVLNAIFGLGTFIPSLSVAVRRLHDINRSGFVLLKYVVAFAIIGVLAPVAIYLGNFAAGLLILATIAVCLKFLILMVTEGDRGPNPYGPNPYGLTYGY